MEERRSLSNEDKKYVLYTVVGDERAKPTKGIWLVRIILGVLLVIALAVVPYVSLRMAQVNDRTLVVFQPVLVRNHSKYPHTTSRNSLSSARSVHSTNIFESASHKMENSSTQLQKRMTSKQLNNGTILSLHESAVTFSLVEDITNETKGVHGNETEDKITPDLNAVLNNSGINNDLDIKTANEFQEIVSTTITEEQYSSPLNSFSTDKPVRIEPKLLESTSPLVTTLIPAKMTNNIIASFSTRNTPVFSELSSSTNKPDIVKDYSSLTTQSTTKPVITHKLAYVAAASSGNHVGGICIWKTNKNITNWSYFFDNIPMEYQSHMDSTDHDLRGLLVAVRMWADKWDDYHVVLRSQSKAIDGSKHHTRTVLVSELEQKAENHFTYELEWRLRKDDSLVAIAYSLSRLYKDFNYWSTEFEQRLEKVVGEQNGFLSKMRIHIPQKYFSTSQVEGQIQTGNFDSLDISRN